MSVVTASVPSASSGSGVVPVELVVLDLAGTTVLDDGVVEGAFARAWDRVRATEDGREAALRHVRDTMGQSKIEVFRRIADEDTAQELNRAFEAAYLELVAEGRCAPIPGAEEVVRELRGLGVAVAFTTGFSRATTDAILADLGWTELADLSLTPAEAGRGRPAPDLPLAALIRVGASSVRALAVVGDTESDAASGRAAGADEVLASVAGLPELLRASGRLRSRG